MSVAKYRRTQQASETPRETERRAFATVIGKLLEAKQKGGAALVDACYLNQRLWSVLLSDLAVPSNGLPSELKARLISIGIWVERYTPRAMAGIDPVDPLISVNRHILDGLNGAPAAAASP